MLLSTSTGVPISTIGGLYSDVPVGTEGKYPPPIEPVRAAESLVDSTGEISGWSVGGSLMFLAGKTGGADGPPCTVDSGREG